MKRTHKILLLSLISLLITPVYAQYYEWQKPVQQNEEVIGIVTKEVEAGSIWYTQRGYYDNGLTYKDKRVNKTDLELYNILDMEASGRCITGYYGEKAKRESHRIALRNFTSSIGENRVDHPEAYQYELVKTYKLSATIVLPAKQQVAPKVEPLKQAITKALQDVREGSRLALDQIKIVNGDKEDFKDKIVEILLDEGYKVVAKDYLEKLYEEQQAQQSGIYNDRTTVQENNFSAVGYYINVKKTETAIKVQVINVSTGEYEANVTINL